MSYLQHVSSGISKTGLRMVVAGVEKMGKTTLVAGAPGVLLIPLEVGYAGVDVHKIPIVPTFEDFQGLLTEITETAKKGKFQFQTLAFDSATALERLIHDYVLRLDPGYRNNPKAVTMESAHGGYGKAYTLANTVFDGVLKQFDQLAVYGGLNILLTCHVFSSKVMDPTSGEYDSWDLLLHSPKNQKTYGKREIITQWADVVGFLYEPIYVMTNEKGNLVRGVSQNKGRVLAVSRTPAYTAGNRFGMSGELPIAPPPANGWNNFADALYKSSGIDLFKR